MAITYMKINGLSCPLGCGKEPPLLSWQVEGAAGTKQTNAVVQVWARTVENVPAWTVQGNLSWEGTPLELKLQPRTRYYVQVDVTDNSGQIHTGTTWFETGKLSEPWEGRWIGPPAGVECAPVLRGAFSVNDPVRTARLYITGLGLYAAALNGRPVSCEVLSPGLWDYEQEVQYQVYDVTSLLECDNQLEVTLGNGWYKGRFGLNREHTFGGRFALLAELHVELESGREQLFASGEGWTWTASQRSPGSIYDGEVLDRLAPEGDPRMVEPVDIPLQVVECCGPPVREMEVLPVVNLLHTSAGETVLDFGQNHTGWLRFRAKLPYGTEVHFDFGEVLQQGNFYNENYRTAIGGFTYRSDGRDETVCQAFTYYGFRYVRITGWPGEVQAKDFESPVLYSALDTTGYISVGHKGLNRLCQNVLWSQKSNFLSIPTDCPQRDERLGWTGDAQVFAPTACYFMDCRAFYRSYLRFLRKEQLRHSGAVPTYIPSMGDFQSCAIWSDAAVLIPDTLLRMTGSMDEVAEYYPMMRDWVDWVAAHTPNYLYDTGFQLGDWLAQDGITPQSFKGATDDVFLATAYYWNSAVLTSQMADLLGQETDAAKYNTLANKIRHTLLDTYFTATGRLSVDTQAAYIVALKFGLYRDRRIIVEQLMRRLKYDRFQIKCGFAGAPLLCQTMAEQGLTRLACDFLLNRGFPGWLYCVELGATTIWERWNSLLADGACSGTGMNSFNHYAYGSVVEFIFSWLAGIRPAGLGFRRAAIAPYPDIRIGQLDCRCRTTSGLYGCSWRIDPDGMLRVIIEVPFGCTARIILPESGQESFEVGAGRYEYAYQPVRDFRLRYDMDTRLSELSNDEAACFILAEEAPQLLAMLQEDNAEFATQTFRELSHAFFMGLRPQQVEQMVSRLSTLICHPGAD